jgi:hypothetical protein
MVDDRMTATKKSGNPFVWEDREARESDSRESDTVQYSTRCEAKWASLTARCPRTRWGNASFQVGSRPRSIEWHRLLAFNQLGLDRLRESPATA